MVRINCSTCFGYSSKISFTLTSLAAFISLRASIFRSILSLKMLQFFIWKMTSLLLLTHFGFFHTDYVTYIRRLKTFTSTFLLWEKSFCGVMSLFLIKALSVLSIFGTSFLLFLLPLWNANHFITLEDLLDLSYYLHSFY